MKLRSIETWRESVPLTRPYTLSRATYDRVDLFFVRIETEEGRMGFGSASPAEDVTGETPEACEKGLSAIAEREWAGKEAFALGDRLLDLDAVAETPPAARAAFDMAFHDLAARALGIPLAGLWGQVHTSLPTSITIGIKSPADTVEEAREYRGRGFRHLKIKLGRNVEEDLERLHRVREEMGTAVAIRVDANEGYDAAALDRILKAAPSLDLEFIEQPFPRGEENVLDGLTSDERSLIGLDESVHNPGDAWNRRDTDVGGWVVKLMKCGGLGPARRIADLARFRRNWLMWGCMDESRLSIAAALHLALSCKATRHLDLDGHLDLATDPFEGGFILEDGCLRLTEAPGLGCEPA